MANNPASATPGWEIVEHTFTGTVSLREEINLQGGIYGVEVLEGGGHLIRVLFKRGSSRYGSRQPARTNQVIPSPFAAEDVILESLYSSTTTTQRVVLRILRLPIAFWAVHPEVAPKGMHARVLFASTALVIPTAVTTYIYDDAGLNPGWTGPAGTQPFAPGTWNMQQDVFHGADRNPEAWIYGAIAVDGPGGAVVEFELQVLAYVDRENPANTTRIPWWSSQPGAQYGTSNANFQFADTGLEGVSPSITEALLVGDQSQHIVHRIPYPPNGCRIGIYNNTLGNLTVRGLLCAGTL